MTTIAQALINKHSNIDDLTKAAIHHEMLDRTGYECDQDTYTFQDRSTLFVNELDGSVFVTE